MDADIIEREKRPSLLRALLFLLVLALIVAGLGTFAFALRSEEGPKVATADPVPISVETVTVALQGDFALDETFTGLITPRRTSQLGFTGSGRIDRLSVDVGDEVEEGATLGRLDTRSLRAQLAAAEAQIDDVIASRELALRTVDRQRTLRDQGHVSQQLVDEASAQASSADARLDVARAQADTLRVQIDLSRIRAPFAGTITQRYFDEGAIAPPGSPIFELVETGALEARIGVPVSTLDALEPGEVYTLSVAGQDVPATLRSVTGVVDMRQRTVTTVFDVVEPGSVAAGAVARLPMERAIEEHGIWVPVSALTASSRGLWSVLVAGSADTGGWVAETRLVEIIHTDGPRAFVRGALNDGDQVIIDGLHRITPGQSVTPREGQLAVSGTSPAGAQSR